MWPAVDVLTMCCVLSEQRRGSPILRYSMPVQAARKHKRWLKLHYPNMKVTNKCDDPNAIHRWCRFKREVIKKPHYHKKHFSLAEEKQALLETALDVTI